MAATGQASVVRRWVLVGLAAPATMTAVAVGLQLSWRSDLPDVVATHWGAGGRADDFGSPTTFLVVSGVIGFGLPALIAATTLPMLMRGARGANFRAMGAVSVGLSALMTVLTTWAVWMQRGLADGHDSPSVTPALLAGLAAGALAGAAGWFAQPHQEAVVEGLTHATGLDLAAGEKAVWMHTTSMARPFAIALGLIVIALGVGSAALFGAGETAAAWIYASTMALIMVLIAATSSFLVRVDDAGLTAVSALGFPRFAVSLDDVVDAGVAPVNGFAEFGGWGIRQRPGVFAIVLRNGESLQVTRRNGRRFVVTVDDAATGAALLTALAARSGTAVGSGSVKE